MRALDLKSIDISGLNLIEASAGTGKTWTIAALYILLLLEKELLPEQILVVTYTKAATSELRDRIRRRIISTLNLYNAEETASEDELEKILLRDRPQNPNRARLLLTRALYSFDNASIYTIHGFCQRALSENAFESSSLFDSEMITDQSAIVSQLTDDFWRKFIFGQPDYFLERLASENFTPEKLAKPFEGQYQNPALKVIPDCADTDLQPLLTKLDELYYTFCAMWKSEQSAILEQLERARLHQGSYSPKQIKSAAEMLNSWVAGMSATASFSKLEFFSIQKIASKSTKTTAFIPDHNFFEISKLIYETKEALNLSYRRALIACRLKLKTWLERELPLRKKALNIRYFDDLLLDLHLSLESVSGVMLASCLRERYRAALIDEFQDTDPIQWNIFKRLSNPCPSEERKPDYPLFLIGDPKQAIYSFRGADLYAYLGAASKVEREKRQSLGTNFRSVPPLVAAVNTLFKAHPDPFLCRDISFHPVISGRSNSDTLLFDGSPSRQALSIWVYPREDESKVETKSIATVKTVQAVAAEISGLLEHGRCFIVKSGALRPLTPGDIAVLVKSHKQASRVQDALRAISVPSVQLGSGTIFETVEAADLLRILRGVTEPGRESLLREALLTSTVGLTANEIAFFLESSGEHPEWEKWLLRFRDLNIAVRSGGIIALATGLLDNCGLRKRLLSLNDGERSLTNILHCFELLHQAEMELGKNLSGLISWLEQRISSGEKDEEALLRLESDDNAVKISTIHASKGLQYPVVFIPFAWDAPSGAAGHVMYHDEKRELTLDLDPDDNHRLLAREERDAEAARLLYVAMTRAEFRCYIVWGSVNRAVDSPLFNLLHGDTIKKENRYFAALTDQAILNDILKFSGDADSGISAQMMPTGRDAAIFRNEANRDKPFICRTPANSLTDSWRVSSFSSMLSGAVHTFQPRDHDYLPVIEAKEITEHKKQPSGDVSIFEFPRGARAGTCLHEIFEQLNFAALHKDDIKNITARALEAGGFSNRWLPAVSCMVSDTTITRIINDDPDFSLSQLKQGAWQSELEFYLPVGQLAPETLRSLFYGLLDNKIYGDFYEVLKPLSFKNSTGMLQGFIDLLFVHAGKYYILDWKSNHLGESLDDYLPGRMQEAMCRNAYILQYHLYTLALDRLLRQRLPDYSYETHFGGAIYIFLRGVSGNDASTGIYHARPSSLFINRANEMILQAGVGNL